MTEPYDIFLKHIALAKKELPDTWNAMALSTVSATGYPSSRYVLLKMYSKNRLTFFTNYTSMKAGDLNSTKIAALLFYWPKIDIQIRITGSTVIAEPKISDEYFSSRPRESQIGAWASKQSQAIGPEDSLDMRINKYTDKFKDEKDIPRPDFWGGYHVLVNKYEFWYQGDNRLHSRERYELLGDVWEHNKIFP